MLQTPTDPEFETRSTGGDSQVEIARLRVENERLRTENRWLRTTLDAYIARACSPTVYGPSEMTAGTNVGPRLRRSRRSGPTTVSVQQGAPR